MPELFLAFWNVENLFDIENAPERTDKVARVVKNELAGWTQAVLDAKVAQLASIVKKMNGGRGPDLLGVCEIENKRVLKLLADAIKQPGRQYALAHHDSSDDRGIDVAFIYDKKLLTANQQFNHVILKRSATRDLFQVNFAWGDKELIVVGNHWPARTGGEMESEPYRMTAGETLSYWTQRIHEEHGPNPAIVAMGDFNDEPFNRSLTDYALAINDRAAVLNARSPKLLNLMWPFLGEGRGTHYFQNAPNVLDQFLVSRGIIGGSSGLGLKAGSVRIEAYPEMTRPGDHPGPISFGRPSKAADFNPKGYSDHFPVSMTLQKD